MPQRGGGIIQSSGGRAPRIAEAPKVHATRSTRTVSADRPGEQEIREDLNWLPFDSSRVSEAAYDSGSGQLYVRFMRPSPGEVEYVYPDVTKNEWRNFRRASAGRYINRILNSKDYHQV